MIENGLRAFFSALNPFPSAGAAEVEPPATGAAPAEPATPASPAETTAENESPSQSFNIDDIKKVPPWVWGAAGGVVLLFLLYKLRIKMQRRERVALLSRRPPGDFQEIYQRHYAQTGLSADVILDVWDEVATILHVDGGQLRPEDSIDWLRCTTPVLRNDMKNLIAFAQAHAPADGSGAHNFRTLDDVILLVAATRSGVRRPPSSVSGAPQSGRQTQVLPKNNASAMARNPDGSVDRSKNAWSKRYTDNYE